MLCHCSTAVPHDTHCWICGDPLLVAVARQAFVSQYSHSATFCDRTDCRAAADWNDAHYGIPAVEVLRRRSPEGRRPPLRPQTPEQETH